MKRRHAIVVGAVLSFALTVVGARPSAAQPPPGGAPYGYPAPQPVPPPAYPYPYPPPAAVVPAPLASPTARRHEGVLFRFGLAQGIAVMTAEAGGVTSKITSTQREMRLAFGVAAAEDFIVFGSLMAHGADDSTAKIGGLTPARESDYQNFSGYGVGVTRYWMPINVYVSTTLLAASADSDGTIGSTNTGVGLDLALGKEWWVSEGIGLGLSAQLLVARMRETVTTVQGERPRWNRVGVSLGLSATFN